MRPSETRGHRPSGGQTRSLASPKPKAGQNWYSYYAGFSEGFARDAIEALDLPAQSRILDPWNGSGTTTAVARALGHRAIGYDLNPVMVVVAKARLLDPGVLPSVESVAKEIVAEARSIAKELPLAEEPLAVWFAPTSAAWLRAIERGIQRVLVSYDCVVSAADPAVASALSTLASFFYVCLFRTVRAHLTRFLSTNPTWIKTPQGAQNRLRPSRASLERRFREECQELSRRLKARAESLALLATDRQGVVAPTIAVADAARLPDDDASVDAVVSSPPYCTRIDYAVATKAELATLGVEEGKSFSALRSSLLGGTLVGAGAPAKGSAAWGHTCREFLRLVERHPSKASKTYYLRGFLQYFRGLSGSLAEVERVLRPAGSCVIVVQDSFYKGERADLSRIVVEMGEALGWRLKGQWDFRHRRTKAAVNPRSRKYRAIADATESVIFLQKAS